MQATTLQWLMPALVFATFGLFAGAASAAKIYTMVVQSTGTNTVDVTFHNVTPENNSTINSFLIYKPSNATSLAFAGSSLPATSAYDANGNLKISGIDGLKSANRTPNTIIIHLTVAWTVIAPSCGSVVSWSSVAYTGNFSTTTFQLVDVTNNNTNISSVPESFNCFTLTGLPDTVSAGTSGKTYTTQLTNKNGAGGPSMSTLTVAGSTSGITATAPTLSPAVLPGETRTVVVTVNTACGASGGNWSASGTVHHPRHSRALFQISRVMVSVNARSPSIPARRRPSD